MSMKNAPYTLMNTNHTSNSALCRIAAFVIRRIVATGAHRDRRTRRLTRVLGLCLLASGLFPLTGARGQAISPANPNASESARKVLSYLYNLPRQSEKRLVSGHLAGGSVAPGVPDGGYRFDLDEIEYLHKMSGQWVGLIGADYCAGWMKSPDPIATTMYYKDVNRGLIDYWKAGGLVVVTTHQFDPRQLYNGGGYNRYIDWPEKDRLDISRLYTPGGEEYANFRVIMDRWAEGLQELQENGVVVLWRPFNEVTNSQKWWCRRPAEHFKALYRYTWEYLTKRKKLNNLLWVYDAVDKTENRFEMSHYPGDAYVDVVGITVSWDSGAGPQPAHPYPKKVFACIEFNVPNTTLAWDAIQRDYDYVKKLNWVKEHLPYASYFMSWDRKSGPYARGTPQSVRQMYNDPAVVNRDDIAWRR